MKRKLFSSLVLAAGLCLAATADALPSFVLAAGAGEWSYDAGSRTWGTASDPFQLVASGGPVPGGTYLLVSGLGRGDFDISIENDGAALARVSGGSVFGVAFELYAFVFDGGSSALASGGAHGSVYQELFDVAVHSLGAGLRGLEFQVVSWLGTSSALKVARVGDAGYVPEPGAVAVFSLATIVAAASIRALRKKG